jgi:hypothetical protein
VLPEKGKKKKKENIAEDQQPKKNNLKYRTQVVSMTTEFSSETAM